MVATMLITSQTLASLLAENVGWDAGMLLLALQWRRLDLLYAISEVRDVDPIHRWVELDQMLVMKLLTNTRSDLLDDFPWSLPVLQLRSYTRQSSRLLPLCKQALQTNICFQLISFSGVIKLRQLYANNFYLLNHVFLRMHINQDITKPLIYVLSLCIKRM